MANIPQGDSATKSVRVPTEAWEQASHEAIDRRTNIVTLFSAAWKAFMALPEAKRERLVRESFGTERQQKGAA